MARKPLSGTAGIGFPHRTKDWEAILAAALYLCVCLLIQWISHASAAAFGNYPDEPAHYVGGLLIHDYLTSGLHQSPLAFAESYYQHLPYFAVGYWPPLFYCIEAAWILLFGSTKAALLWLMAAVAAGSAWLIFYAVRREAGLAAAFCSGLLFLGVPEVQRQFCTIMLDLPVTFLVLCATLFAARYLSKGAWTDSIGFSVFAAAACLAKYSAGYICLVPFLGILVLRRWRRLKAGAFWAQPAIILALVAPWAIWSAHMASVGLPPGHVPLFIKFDRVLRAFARMLPWSVWIMVAAGLAGWIWRPVRWRETSVAFAVHIVALIGFVTAASVAPEWRYFIPGAAAILVAGVSGFRWLTLYCGRNWLTAALFASVLIAFTLSVHRGTQLRVNNFGNAVNQVIAQPRWRGAAILVAGDAEGPMIAEFAMRDPRRPGYTLIRPGKILSQDDWFGGGYKALVQTADEVQSALTHLHVQAVILRNEPIAHPSPHDVLLRQAITTQPQLWCRVNAGPGESSYDVFETCSPGLSQ